MASSPRSRSSTRARRFSPCGGGPPALARGSGASATRPPGPSRRASNRGLRASSRSVWVLPVGSQGTTRRGRGGCSRFSGRWTTASMWRSGRRGPRISRGATSSASGLGASSTSSKKPLARQAPGLPAHDRAEVPRGLRAPLTILSELAETRVPGEPLFIAEEGGMAALRAPSRRGALHADAEDLRGAGPDLHERGRHGSPRCPRVSGAGCGPFSRSRAASPAFAKLRNWRSQLQESPSTSSPGAVGPGLPGALPAARARRGAKLGGLRGHPLLSRGASLAGDGRSSGAASATTSFPFTTTRSSSSASSRSRPAPSSWGGTSTRVPP